MANIRDFFTKRDSQQPSQSQSPVKRQVTLDGSDLSDFQPQQKLKRSTKTLVKSKSKTNLSAAVDLTNDTPVKPTPAEVEPPVTPMKKTPIKLATPVKIISPVKQKTPSPIKKTPMAKKRIVIEDDDDEEFVPQATPEKAKPVAKAKKTVENIEPTEQGTPTSAAKKFNYREYLAKKNTVPAALGSKEIPEGAPNCLEGLSFLFTGDLSSITRDMASDLVKRYAGRVVSAPSKKTNFVVVGENPGPSKMDKVKALGLNCIDEDEFLEMIRQSNPSGQKLVTQPDGPPTETLAAPVVQTAPSAKQSKAPAATAQKSKEVSSKEGFDLWTVKYAPQNRSDIIGNPGIYEKLSDWLANWKADTAENKASLLSGPPGIGKTTMANLVCKELGYDSIEMNASDTRNKKTLHETVKEIIDSTSLSSMFSKHKVTKKHVLIMDEVDGMSAGDRGGMAELIMLIKKTKIPIICICNDRASPKVRSLANHCLDLRLRRPDARQIVPRIKAIAEQEGLIIQPNALEELVVSTHADIRQILNLLSTFKLTKGTLSYDASKGFSIGAAKDIEQGPFEATGALLGSGQWKRMSLNQKIDQYFIDGSLVPLMVHENYMKCRATSAREIISTQNTKPNYMELCAAAADSLSLSDRVDSLIRGSNQEWSLAPMHAITTSVLPAYYVQGQMGGRIDFAGWLGQNSRTTKNQRLLTEITKHSFIHTRAGKQELRLDYLSSLASSIVSPMSRDGIEGIEKTIQFMDDYSLSRDDIDSVLDICLNPSANSASFSKIPTTVRSTFTRKYNQGIHRLPYSLGGSSAPAKRISIDIPTGEAEDDDEALLITPDDDEADTSEDLSKDKMIKAKPVKAKKAPAPKKAKK